MGEQWTAGTGGEIQLTDALKVLAGKEDMYAYIFEGKRYDVGDKQGFLEATVETTLRRSDLRDEFLQYLVKVVEKEVGTFGEVEYVEIFYNRHRLHESNGYLTPEDFYRLTQVA